MTGSTSRSCGGRCTTEDRHRSTNEEAEVKDASTDASTYVGREEMSIESLPTKPRRPAF